MKFTSSIVFGLIAGGFAVAAQAQIPGNIVGGPITGAGQAIEGTAAAHAGIAPTANAISPSVERTTDGVTNAIGAVGTGVTGTGQDISANGVQVGATASGRPLVSVGTTNPAQQGSVAALLNGPGL